MQFMMMTTGVVLGRAGPVGLTMTAGMADGGGGITGITAIGTVTIAGPVIEIMTMGTTTASPTTSANLSP